MKIVNCQTNHLTQPLGYQMDRPVFSWQVTETNAPRQAWARIRVSRRPDMDGLCYDSGEAADLDSLAASADMVLEPRTRYYWTVTVCAEQGAGGKQETAVSEVNWFETGKRSEGWSARWITCAFQPRHPVFTREISLSGELQDARLYLCGLGLYEAEIDGSRISGEYLTPYCNNYAQWLQYQTYDVTGQLRNGGGTLRVTVGKGWYAGRFGYRSQPGDPGHFGRDAVLIAELHLRYTDGREEVIGTDESWTVVRSHIVDSSIYDGEQRDDTLPETEPEAAVLLGNGAAAMTSRLTERYSPAVRIQERIAPAELLHTPAGELVLDMGQNLVGTFALHVHEPAGRRIRVQTGEVLQNGCFYRDNLRNALSEYTYVSDGTEKTVQPRFTFYGYRYVKIEGIPSLRKEDFTALVLYSDTPAAGRLTTGHAGVNRLIRNAEWGQKGNFLDVPTDCPQRNERMGWTGDAQVFSATACLLRQCYPFYRKYLHDMATEQRMLDGMTPDVVPSFGREYQGTAAVWGDACCIIPWNLYLYYGDRTILEEQFDSMKAWVDYLTRLDGDDHGWGRHFHYGDWLALDHPDHKPDQCLGGTDEAYIADVYYRGSAQLVVRAARLLGKEEEEKKYSALVQRLTDWITNEYFSPNGRCCVDTQTGLLLALRNHLSPRPDICLARLKKKLEQAGGKLQTGFVGTPFLCEELTKGGLAETAYDLLLNEEYPGWLYEVKLGATTIWERWNSLNPDGSVSSTGMNSFNHYAYGSIVEWICRCAAGLQPKMDRPGFRGVVIRPAPDVRLGRIDFTYESAAGRYRVFWDLSEDRSLRLELEIPFGCEAELILPSPPEPLFSEAAQSGNPAFREVSDGVCHLRAGHYEIAYKMAQEGAYGGLAGKSE